MSDPVQPFPSFPVPQHTQPPQRPTRPVSACRCRRRWWVAGALAVGITFGIPLGLAGATPAGDPTPGSAGTAAAAADPSPAPVSSSRAPSDSGTVQDGTWLVGEDIPPGRYRTVDVVPTDPPCYWERSDPSKAGALDGILANDLVSGGRPTVTLHEGEQFTSARCGAWTRVG
jgi:hypothetical protein